MMLFKVSITGKISLREIQGLSGQVIGQSGRLMSKKAKRAFLSAAYIFCLNFSQRVSVVLSWWNYLKKQKRKIKDWNWKSCGLTPGRKDYINDSASRGLNETRQSILCSNEPLL